MVSCFSNEAFQIGADVLLLLEVPLVDFEFLPLWNHVTQYQALTKGTPRGHLASFPGLLTPAFVACSTSTSRYENKRWGEKAWE